MKRLLFALSLIALLGLLVGCSDDDNPTGGGGTQQVIYTAVEDSTVYDTTGNVYVSNFDAATSAFGLDLSSVAGAQPLAAVVEWDLQFDRSTINVNGGASANGGDVWTYDLGEVNYLDVGAADTTGVAWTQDAIQHIVNEWYSYNPQTHMLTATNYVYTLVDAEGDNYIKMRVDSMVTLSQGPPPAELTVYFTYYYNSTPNSKMLTGDGTLDSIHVLSANGYKGYYDFSTGSEVTPGDPSTSTDWDINIGGDYEIYLNSGPNGPGSCAAFPMFGELSDPTSMAECSAQPAMAPMFEDYIASVFNGDINDADANWYNYNGATHELTSKAHVYLIRNGSDLYKMRIDSYYRNIGGLPTSGYYTIIWNEL